MTEYEHRDDASQISPKRLWFGFSAAALAWIVAGLLNVFLAWQACMGGELGSGPFTTIGMRIMLGVITFALLGVAIAAGYIAYHNWRMLSDKPDFISAEGRERREYMGLTGVIVSAWLGVGIMWFSIPIYILGPCVRPR